jgi:hypothetical protein
MGRGLSRIRPTRLSGELLPSHLGVPGELLRAPGLGDGGRNCFFVCFVGVGCRVRVLFGGGWCLVREMEESGKQIHRQKAAGEMANFRLAEKSGRYPASVLRLAFYVQVGRCARLRRAQ